MCNVDGTPKRFQTQLKSLAILKAEKESRRTGKKFRVYYCYWCHLWCLTAARPKNKTGSEQRKKKKLRVLVEAWENEGGAIHPNE